MSGDKPDETPIKNLGGPPSKFKEEYCQKLIDHMSQGFSFVSFQAVVDVCEDTLHDWVKRHPSWAEAKKKAFALCLLFWERAGIEGLHDITEYDEKTGKPISKKSLNSTVWIFNMKNRHKWRDRQPDEQDTVINNNNNVQGLTDEEFKKKYDEAVKKIKEKGEVK